MKILAAQINPIIGDFLGNTKKIIDSLERARQNKADIVLFSELTLTGYPPQDLLLHDAFMEDVQKALEKVMAASHGLMVVVGLPRHNPNREEKPLYNSAAVLINGTLVGYYDKWLLPTYDVFDERRYFGEGKSLGIVEYKGKKIGVTICEDVWQPFESYPRDPIAELALLQPDFVLNLSASPYHYQKPDKRIKVCIEATRKLKCPMIMCCQVGGNDQLVFDGNSCFVDKNGQLCGLAKGFEEDDLWVDLEGAHAPIAYEGDSLQHLFQALVLGTRDYFVKQGFQKACLGLSGGIDSALAACIAVEALGKENVLGLAMPSLFSSSGSVTDAEALAINLGMVCRTIAIDQPFDAFLNLLQSDLNLHKMNVAEENVQARIRGMILMAMSNKYGYIVLSTGNKSEMAMGYCTLYGDMAGGLALISDVTKGQVYALCKWINREREIIPYSTIEKPPSAELRPNQKDSDFLPNYDIVDAVVTAYVEDYLDVQAIAAHYQIESELVKDLIHRIHKAEYKRRQAPPGIRVSRKSFRTGRFYPIVQKWV